MLHTHDCMYIVYGHEIAPTTGTPHLQGFVYYANARQFESIRKIFHPHHIEIAKGDADQNRDYCTKDDKFYERGIKPASQKEKGASQKEAWKSARQNARIGNFDDIADDIYIRYQSSLKRIRLEDGPRPEHLPEASTYGVWVYGPPRHGKTTFVRTKYPLAYLKDQNKWWDQYHGQDEVILEDYDPKGPDMTGFFKRWCDRWVFSCETKGGTIFIRPKLIVVTSNYSIKECFRGVDGIAIAARFQEIDIKTQV